MTVTSATYANEENTTVAAVINGQTWTIPADRIAANDGELPRAVKAWIDAGNTIAAYSAPAPTVDDVVIERKRRLALGFDYDFQDARGVHHIGTTADDMTGWREVIDYANALVDLGDTSTQIAIVTDTAPSLVTAPEWQAVMLQAAQVRQAIWAKSFALQAMSPIPSDYANDTYWT
jgi:hypothetical protein